MAKKLSFRIASRALAVGLAGFAVFIWVAQAAPPAPATPAAGALSPSRITALAAQLDADINTPAIPSQPYAVVAKFAQVNISSSGAASASAITSVIIAGAALPGTRIRDVDLGDGLAHAAVSFGVNSAIAKSIAATVGREATRPVRIYFAEVTKALTGVTTLADIAKDDVAGVGDISNGVPNGLGVTLTPNLPGTASCLNPSCTQL
jgi:hypothetical protein